VNVTNVVTQSGDLL